MQAIVWLNGLIKSTKLKNLELSIGIKRKYELENPIDWELGHCCIYKFPLKLNPTNFDATVNNMTHPNFIIFRDYKVLRILSFWTRAVINRITKKHWRISQKVSKFFENDYLFTKLTNHNCRIFLVLWQQIYWFLWWILC